MRLDLRLAVNAVSDIVDNRPQPLREFDQIYMKSGDLVVHAEFIARHFDEKRVAFMGDGDAVALATVHLRGTGVVEYGPREVRVFDFDERLTRSVAKFAREYGYEDQITSVLYNVIDPLPPGDVGSFDAFHINPPWGEHNEGESAVIFLERAAQLIHRNGIGVVVVADAPELAWAESVLSRCQSTALANDLVVAEMVPALHAYHLPDAPDLRSCTMLLRSFGERRVPNEALGAERLQNFYGRSGMPRVKYIRDVPRVGPDKADKTTYFLQMLEKD